MVSVVSISASRRRYFRACRFPNVKTESPLQGKKSLMVSRTRCHIFRFSPSLSEAAGATAKFLRLAAELLTPPQNLYFPSHSEKATREVPRTRPVGWISRHLHRWDAQDSQNGYAPSALGLELRGLAVRHPGESDFLLADHLQREEGQLLVTKQGHNNRAKHYVGSPNVIEPWSTPPHSDIARKTRHTADSCYDIP